MLIPLSKIISTYGLEVKKVLHIGAWDGIEMEEQYLPNGIDNVCFIEANDKIMPTLLGRIKDYPNSKAIKACVSDVSGIATLNITNNGQSTSILPLGTHADLYPSIFVETRLVLEVTTIKDLLPEFDYDFVNIDIQGAELKAIKGMSDEQIEKVECFYLEVNKKAVYADCALIDEIDYYLESKGFVRVETANWIDDSWTDAVYLRLD
jgi:FkbM family methyltransferase